MSVVDVVGGVGRARVACARPSSYRASAEDKVLSGEYKVACVGDIGFCYTSSYFP